MQSLISNQSLKINACRPGVGLFFFGQKKYNGEVGKVVFGHNYFKQNGPYYFEHAIGIDNGCVYGGWLTALIIDAHSNISSLSVQSNQFS